MTPPARPDPVTSPLGISDAGEQGESRGEQVHTNRRTCTGVLTICIPSFRHTAVRLVRDLGALPGADQVALVIYDDGSGDPALNDAHAGAIDGYPGPARLVMAADNRGRSHARNRLVSEAATDWVLLLDADMLPDDDQFLVRYLSAISQSKGPELVAGGFSLNQVSPASDQRLHAAQARQSDCLQADLRNRAPGRYVFTSNILVHRSILDIVPFDDEFTGWGWEDVDWGLRVAAIYPVRHIDNTATHMGLEPDDRLLQKFGTSGHNFARLVSKHPAEAEAMPLMRAARRVKGIPLVQPVARSVAASRWLPDAIRVFALKLYRASAYSNYIARR